MQKKSAVTLAAVMMMAVPVCSFAAVANNEVTSAKIKDGEVKTVDIADAAVTTAKIAAGAVTDAKITGPISVSKLPVGTTSTTLAAGNHTHDTVYTKKRSNIVVVAKSGGDFTSPVAAMASITTASATNPYVVKVMPGVYDLGTASLQLKEYVALEGSGRESTVITSSNYNNGTGTCEVGTVIMANNSSIEHLKVVNRGGYLDPNNYPGTVALVFNNVKATAEGINVLTGSDTVSSGYSDGICTTGSAAHATLNNVNIETRNLDGQSNPIEYMGGNITLTNSKLTGFNVNGSVDVINNNYAFDPANPGAITVTNSVLEGTANYLQGITADGGAYDPGAFDAFVSNSTIILHSSGNTAIIATGSKFVLENSKIIIDGGTANYNVDPAAASRFKFINSQLPGDRSNLAGARLLNCYDENYDLIPNQ